MELPEFNLGIVAIILQLIFLEGILSIDNAAALGAMVAPLPGNRPVPWPGILRPIGHILDPILGPQRLAALKVGLLGAYVGRGLMLVMASFVINNPWLQFLGALYLLKIAIEHLGSFHVPDEEEIEEEVAVLRQRVRGFWATVLMVELMDLAFSLDNVVVAVTLSRNLLVVMTGVFLGIVTMRFAAGLFVRAIEKEPILATGAYILILNIGIEFLLTEFLHIEFHELTRFVINVTTIALVLVYAHTPVLQRALARPFAFIARLFAYLDRAINLVFLPITWVLHLLWDGALRLFANGRRDARAPIPPGRE